MKILYVCHRFPYPPKRGGKIRPFNMIRHLHDERGHEVVVASLARNPEEAKEGQGIAPHCTRFIVETVKDPLQSAKMVLNLPRRTPSSMGFFHSKRLGARIKEELATGNYDLVFVHCSSVAQYVQEHTGCPKILDFGDMDSQKWISYGPIKPFPLSLGYYFEGFKMQLAEVELTNKFNTCTATTKMELATIRGLNSGIKSDWFPNGVDSKKFEPTDEPYDPDTIVFIGRMDYYPNQECMFDFTKNTWPLLKKRRPSLKLQIVGAEPSKEVWDLAKLDGVEVTGSVPEVQPYVRKAVCTVAPLNIARGTQNKILEALSMGVPTVCSDLAAGGVDAVPGEHFLTASSPAEYAEAILRLVEDPKEREKFSQAGRARMLSNHSWASSMVRLDGIIEETVARYRRDHGGQSS